MDRTVNCTERFTKVDACDRAVLKEARWQIRRTTLIKTNNMTKSVTLNYGIAILAAVAMVVAYALPTATFAAVNSTYIEVPTVNRGTINNTTEAKAHTGENTAEGSEGGDGGYGGDVESNEDAGTGGNYNNGGAAAGDGGNGGDADDGGLVETGDATANAATANDLNGTEVDVDLTTQEDVNGVYVEVDTDNGGCECDESTINNDTRARARSGENTADGSEGGDGQGGGDVEANDGADAGGDYNNGGASAGDGGNGGDSGFGGTVRTGFASSTAGTINLLNTTIVRVRL